MHPSELALTQPDKPAVILGGSGKVITYADLDRISNQGAHLFRSLGLKAGDHIAMQLENGEHFVPLLWAARRSGLIYTAMSTHLKRDEVTYIVRNCEAKVVIISASLGEVGQAAREIVSEVAHWYMVDEVAPGFESWESALARQPGTPIADEQSGIPMLYSSGTTGQPKGIMPPWQPGQPVGPVPQDIAGLARLFGFDGNTVYLSPAPLYHAAPLMYVTMVTLLGGTCVIMEKFDAERCLALVEQHKITHAQFVPIMFVRMLQLSDATRLRYDVSSFKYAIHAAAPCPQDIKQRMIDWWGPVVYEYYSSTEGGGFVSLNSQEWLQHRGSVGRAIVGVLHIVGEDGQELPAGEIGTVYFSDIRTRFEYYKEPGKTSKAYNEQGWMTVGDVGYLDADGYLYLSDRKDFMIISGGVNVYPQEIENLLQIHDAVADVAVFGVPDAEFGETVKAVVQPRDWLRAGPELEKQLIAYCRERLSHVKCPRSIDFDAHLPRLDNGKLYKKQIRARYLKS
ncbi:MAG: LongchainfattyacidCoA ligase [Hydrocarboniphaga sp.]|uniref:acyl-CoA synthetase n=1 Tax=Hydrocarboniphaga sp. TaxID=2033016 RepID=UPI0026204334|nr:acyl-CoA synthetase [Hydrocarboniphaga sp.]MDB5969957.1 LongchainfattyacidCoA ligase [Hydrocarboniphaga sp.]